MTHPLWQPDERFISAANLTHFMKEAGQRVGATFASYDDLHAFSIDNPAAFWKLIWDMGGVKGDAGPGPHAINLDRIAEARFFPDGRLNFTENLLAGDGNAAALVFWGEARSSGA